MKTSIINPFTRFGQASRAGWACLGRALMRSQVLPALIAGLSLMPSGRVTAQTFTTLHSFTAANGISPPYAGLTIDSSGNTLYGTAGTVFALNTDGSGFTNLPFSDGVQPQGGLILSGNTLYGTAIHGGSFGNGTVFKVNTNGTGSMNLHSFTTLFGGTNSDGAYPLAGLTLSGNVLYGTAQTGGTSGNGTMFAINTDGTGFTNLHSFTAGSGSVPNVTNSDGVQPHAGLALSGNTLYGTAAYGGSFGNGTVFKVNTGGTGFTTLHSFTYADGAYPSGLILSGSTLYGTASFGGSSGNGTVFAVKTNGTGFTTLHSFTAGVGITNSDGANPYDHDRLYISGNTLYGTAFSGGSFGNGTVFKINTDGTGFTNLHSFTATTGPYPSTNSDGSGPYAGLVLSGNTLDGTASVGGSSGWGTVFSLSFRPQLTITHQFSRTGRHRRAERDHQSHPRPAAVLSVKTVIQTNQPRRTEDNEANEEATNGKN